MSIVIPAYNEAHRLGSTLRQLRAYMEQKPFPVELIAVDDGSADHTPQILANAAASWPALHILRNEPNRGKGYSVRRGILAARGEYVLFTDADLSAPIEEADKLFAQLQSSGADAAVGSRALDRKLIGVRQPWFREHAGRIFNLAVRIFTGLKIADTQCGLKLFRRASTRRVFQMQRVERFGFDPEVLFLIERLGGKVVEVPVRWNNDPATKVHFLRDSLHMLADLIRLRWRASRGQYPR